MMRDSNVSEAFRAVACSIGLIVLATVLFSSCFIAGDAGHDCCGDGCPICTCIRLSEDAMHILSEGTAILFIHVFPVFMIFSAVLFNDAASLETPVSRKIRLNN